MVRLRNDVTGVVVSVADDKAERLFGYSPVEAEIPKPRPARAKRTSSSSTDDEK